MTAPTNARPSKDEQAGKTGQGVDESRQDHAQDEAAKRRPGTQDMQIHDENTRRPSKDQDTLAKGDG